MFEVGFQELVLIALLALIVLGPEKLPKLAAKLGHWTGQARSMARHLRHQLEQEVSYDELLKQKQAAEEALRKATSIAPELNQDLAPGLETNHTEPALVQDDFNPVTLATNSSETIVETEAKPSVSSSTS
jgi:sec-independent protein translocase protein TatB